MLWPEELPREAHMTSSDETGHITGTRDKDYNIIWFTEACLSNALRLETYIQDAEREGDSELADFFRRPRPRAARAPSRASSCCAHGWEAEQLGPGGCHPQRGALCLWSAAELAGATGAEQRVELGRELVADLASCPWVTAS